MFGLPFICWILGFIFYALLAIPMYFLWNYVAPTYFFFLPAPYLRIPFWDMTVLFCTLSILRSFVFPSFGSSASSTSSCCKK